ncbi:hypothetical protein ACFL0V_02080 [Nanoarchaeota archaeon]
MTGNPPSTAPPGVGPQPAPAPPKKKPGLFAPKPKAGGDLGKNVADLAAEMNNINRRLRVIEERYTSLRNKTQVTDQNMLTANKKLMTEVQTGHSEIDDMRKDLNDMKDKFKIMIQELRGCAKKQDVQVLQKYINMWQPINFITREAALKLIHDEVQTTFRDLNVKLQQEKYIKEQIKLVMEDLKK